MKETDILEIIVHANKRKFGKLCLTLNELLISEPTWFSFEATLDDMSHATGRSMFDSDLPNSSNNDENSFGTL